MLILDSNLQAAQDGEIHHPIIKLFSQKPIDDIPFIGNVFTSNTTEMKPKFIVHSSGRIIGFNLKYFDSNTNHLYMFYTDENRIEFNIDIPVYTNQGVADFAIVELVNGNIGVLFIQKNGNNYVLYRGIISPTGSIVTNFAYIMDDTSLKNSISLVKSPNGNYLCVYNRWTGSEWQIWKRYSSDFLTWSGGGGYGETEFFNSLGLPSKAVNRVISGLFLMVDSSDVLLFFDYVDSLDTNNNPLKNIYYSKSTDNGSTWGNAVKITNYTDFTKIGYYPSAVINETNEIYLGFTEESGALWLDKNTSGYPSEFFDASNPNASYVMLDSANQKLYAMLSHHGPAYNYCYGIIEIDINSWSIIRTIDFNSTPALPDVFLDANVSSNRLNYIGMEHGNKVVFGSGLYVGVFDAVADSIKTYYLRNNITYGISQNISGYPYDLNSVNIETSMIQYSEEKNRIYYLNSHLFGATVRVVIGYIDLSEVGPTYTFNLMFDNVISRSAGDLFMRIDDSYVIISNYNNDHCYIFDLSGNQIKYYERGPSGLPYNGLKNAIIMNNTLFGVFDYSSQSGFETQKGLCKIDLVSDDVQFYIPPYKTVNEYGFITLNSNDNLSEIYIGTSSDGIVIFNTVTEQFTRLSADEIVGITPSNSDVLYYPTYDSLNERFFSVSWGSSVGITTFLREGKFKRTYYKIGTKSPSLSFNSSELLINSVSAFNSWIGIDEGNKIWTFWQRDTDNFTKHYLNWDSIEHQFDLSEYIITDKEIEWRRTVDGKPNELSFSLSFGHLFDYSNTLSLFSPYVKKGRKIVLQAGEKVNGTPYYHNQGTFIVTETSINYSTKSYPEITVKSEDKRCLWDEDNQVTVGYVNEYPENILNDFLTTGYVGLSSEEINIPVSMQGRTRIDAQWAEVNISEVINTIVKRFGYFPKITIDDVFTIEKISDTNIVTHIYSDKKAILDYSPDDKYSSFVNRIIVTGEERDEIEVLFPEERIESLNGTAGWWGHKKTYDIWYSNDQSRRVRYPRLVKLESTTSIMFELAGSVDESISYIDPEEKYCEVKIDCPDLIPHFTAALGIIVSGYFIPDWDVSVGPSQSIPIGRYITDAGIFLALNVLGSMVNYQYEIWGRPIGYIRRSVQYTENDLEFQQEIGRVISNMIEGFACYTVGDCRFVAELEMMLLKLQRKRVKFSKTTHLQDEEGDTIQIPHPYTSFPVKLFISDLIRKWKLGENGYCLDEIEGWRI